MNFHLVKAKDLPTNIWNYHGIRIENIKPDAQDEFIQYYFSIFGDIKEISQSISPGSKESATIFIYYFNPATPMFTIAYFQNQILKELCVMQGNSYLPLKLYFAHYNSDYNYQMPLRPLYNIRQECYYWRTTGCEREKNCSKLHILENKNIDSQIWMKKH